MIDYVAHPHNALNTTLKVPGVTVPFDGETAAEVSPVESPAVEVEAPAEVVIAPTVEVIPEAPVVEKVTEEAPEAVEVIPEAPAVEEEEVAEEEVAEGEAVEEEEAAVDPILAFLNDATEQELEAVNGIGDIIAQRILDGRPYATLEDVEVAASTINAVKAHLA